MILVAGAAHPDAPSHRSCLVNPPVMTVQVARTSATLGLATPLMLLAHIANTQPQLAALPRKAVLVSRRAFCVLHPLRGRRLFKNVLHRATHAQRTAGWAAHWLCLPSLCTGAPAPRGHPPWAHSPSSNAADQRGAAPALGRVPSGIPLLLAAPQNADSITFESAVGVIARWVLPSISHPQPLVSDHFLATLAHAHIHHAHVPCPRPHCHR